MERYISKVACTRFKTTGLVFVGGLVGSAFSTYTAFGEATKPKIGPVDPYVSAVSTSPFDGSRVSSRLIRRNTEIEPCLHLDRIDWTKQSPDPTVTNFRLCSFTVNGEVTSIPGQSTDYYNLSWSGTTASFVIENLAAAPSSVTRFFDCKLDSVAKEPIIDCKRLDYTSEGWDKTSPKPF